MKIKCKDCISCDNEFNTCLNNNLKHLVRSGKIINPHVDIEKLKFCKKFIKNPKNEIKK